MRGKQKFNEAASSRLWSRGLSRTHLVQEDTTHRSSRERRTQPCAVADSSDDGGKRSAGTSLRANRPGVPNSPGDVLPPHHTEDPFWERRQESVRIPVVPSGHCSQSWAAVVAASLKELREVGVVRRVERVSSAEVVLLLLGGLLLLLLLRRGLVLGRGAP